MNHFAIGTMAEQHGYIGWFRKVHRAENEVVKKNGKSVIFSTRQEAKLAAADAFVSYMNSEMVRDGETASAAHFDAHALFPTLCRQKGSSRVTKIEHAKRRPRA